jgi:inorganic pyrophosphatase
MKKIIAVAKNDMSVSHFNDVSELRFLEGRNAYFFQMNYKKLEKKNVAVEDSKAVKSDGNCKSIYIDYKKKFGK